MKISIKEWLCIIFVYTLLFIISDPLLRYLYEIIPTFTLDDPILVFLFLLLNFIIPGVIVYFGFWIYVLLQKEYKKKFTKV